ncbi:serine hydrolase [Flavobacterium sp.]|uniref:serine hydrolase n=1 Tax=Flavobacterium sp. TaxID=239 RepID=UPI00286ADE21|nr:serine hydrolase [Flavobacterium sp.]
MPLIKKRFSWLSVILFSVVSVVVTLLITNWLKDDAQTSETANSKYSCKYDVKRLDGLKYIKPIMFVDDECESENLQDIKQQITEIVDRYKNFEGVTSASVYLKQFANNGWICVNETESFEPGSLFKVPVMITILKMCEDDSGFLNKRIVYEKFIDDGKKVAFKSKSIQLGQSYTVKELLTYMIKYSDNKATILLESQMKADVLQKLFTDLGLEAPNIYANQYFFTTSQYSLFVRTIYSSTYLTTKNSEYAAELLSQCDFKQGIVSGLPKGTSLIHKFGESGNQIEMQLHESAIIYAYNKPFLLTIMTKGKDNKTLSKLIKEVTNRIYTEMANK